MQYLNVIMLVCQLNDPSACQEQSIKIEGSLKNCMWEAQIGMAQWSGDHPKYHIERFHCEPMAEPT